MAEALWHVISTSGVEMSDMLIFLPSRRAVRTVEQMLVNKFGGALVLPHLYALGEGVDDTDEIDNSTTEIISNTERCVILSRLLAADACVGNLSSALPLARDLVRMTDYLENEGIDATTIDWNALVDESYAAHFQRKANLLNILTRILPAYSSGRITAVMARNNGIREWISRLNDFGLVIVCSSTASVPATADLMRAVVAIPHGRLILPGHISGNTEDFMQDTNPYNSEYKFLSSVGVVPEQVQVIDVGTSAVDFLTYSFGNNPKRPNNGDVVAHCHLIECSRESEEAIAVAEISKRAIKDGKSVLVITPDAAGNQRISAALAEQNIVADFSGGMSGLATPAGRAILNIFDKWIDDNNTDIFDKLYLESNNNLFETIVNIVSTMRDKLSPEFDVENDVSIQIWRAIRDMSDYINRAQINLTLADARTFLADAIGGVCVRSVMNVGASVVVLGTIESRMQTADVVILTGLNEGMFPARGYENSWLPINLATKIGLPSPDRKVSLQALDFINLSCNPQVYWLRSCVSGGVQTTQSRFLSRVIVRGGMFDKTAEKDILGTVRNRDNVAQKLLDYSAPTPPADWSDVYVTELELLIHNPYAFYVRHILRLKPKDDYWIQPDGRDFGNLVHDVIEHATDFSPSVLVAEMDKRARDLLGGDSIVFHFWHKRFVEMAPVIFEVFSGDKGYAEIEGAVNIAKRCVRARVDRIWDGVVLDIKTGAAPSKTQLLNGNMPQLGLEAYMMRHCGIKINLTSRSATPVIKILQLKNKDVRLIEYDAVTTAQMMRAAVDKTTEMINVYSVGGAPYEYHETGNAKYKMYDDFARISD